MHAKRSLHLSDQAGGYSGTEDHRRWLTVVLRNPPWCQKSIGSCPLSDRPPLCYFLHLRYASERYISCFQAAMAKSPPSVCSRSGVPEINTTGLTMKIWIENCLWGLVVALRVLAHEFDNPLGGLSWTCPRSSR